jgi:hypothetical protein
VCLEVNGRYWFAVLVITLYFVIPVSGSENLTAISLTGNEVFHYNMSSYPASVVLRDNVTLYMHGLEAEILLYNETITPEFYAYNNSRIFVLDSVFPGSFELYDGSSITVRNSTIFRGRWCPIHRCFHNGSGITARDYGSVKVDDSKIGVIKHEDAASSSIRNTSIQFLFGGNTIGSTCELKSCELGFLRLFNIEHDLIDVRKGVIEDRVFDQQSGITYHLLETELKHGLELYSDNASYFIDSCDIYSLLLHDGSKVSVNDAAIRYAGVHSSGLEMSGCEIGLLHIFEGSNIILESCVIDRIEPIYSLNFTAKNTQINQYYLANTNNMILENTNLTITKENFWELDITGSFNLVNSTLPLLSAYHDVRINRTYPLTITRNGKPLGDAVVYLKKEGETLGEYVSDERGRTEFNVIYENIFYVGDVFDYESGNVTDSYKLTVLSAGQNETRTIDIYTQTPIRIDFKPKVNYNLIYLTITATTIIIYLTYRYANQKTKPIHPKIE